MRDWRGIGEGKLVGDLWAWRVGDGIFSLCAYN